MKRSKVRQRCKISYNFLTVIFCLIVYNFSILTSVVRYVNPAQGHSKRADTSDEKACSRLAPPTSTESFLEALLYPTCRHKVMNNKTTPPCKKITAYCNMLAISKITTIVLKEHKTHYLLCGQTSQQSPQHD